AIENHAKPREHNARAKHFGAQSFRFPILSQDGQKVLTCLARFGQRLIAATAVIADGRSADQYIGFGIHFSERSDESASCVNAAGAKQVLPPSGPAAITDRSASQIDDRLRSDRSTAEFASFWIPCDIEGTPGATNALGRRSNQPADHVAIA